MVNETRLKMKLLFILSMLAVLLTGGCKNINMVNININAKNKIKGSGTVTKERREVSPFNEIRIASGPFAVYLSQGDIENVEIEIDDNLQQYVETRNEMNRLVLDIKDDVYFHESVQNNVYITLKNIARFDAGGFGKIKTLNPLNCGHFTLNASGVTKSEFEVYCDELTVNNSGVADVKFSGATAKLDVNNSGVGTLNAMELKAAKASVFNSGVGNVKVYATEELWMTSSGMGSITYSGGAEIKTRKTNGFGKITKSK